MALIVIGTHPNGEAVQFRPDAAASFLRYMSQIGGWPSVNRTVVAFEVQAELRRQYLRGEYPYYVAPPEESDHVYRSDTDGGNAWDTEEYRYNRQLLIDHGWKQTDKSEAWHWVYFYALDQYRHLGIPSGVINATITTQEEESAMKLIFIKDQGGTASLWSLLNESQPLVPGENPIQTRDQSIANSWARMNGNAKTGDSADGGVQDFLNQLEAVRLTTRSTKAAVDTIIAITQKILAGEEDPKVPGQ